MMGDGGSVVTPGGLEEDAGGGAGLSRVRGAGEQGGALTLGKLAARDQVTRETSRGGGQELRL